MKRIETSPRENWQKQAEELGFIFHTMYGQAYWDESRFYQFSLSEIENQIEDPSRELHLLCLEVVDRIIGDEKWLAKMAIPDQYWDMIAESWAQQDASLYGRFDLVWQGNKPAKMLEYNADTPTSLYEAAFFQWVWLQDMITQGRVPADADQYNALQEQLITRFEQRQILGQKLYFSCAEGSDEDRQTVRYLQDCAHQAGLEVPFIYMEDIALAEDGQFLAPDSENGGAFGDEIHQLFKLYPWEDMFREDFGPAIPQTNTVFLEPPWKALLSNKALLALLWHFFPGHPNLLPSYFADDPRAASLGNAYVKKPFFSREGANVTLQRPGDEITHVAGPYGAEGSVVQAYCPLPKFGQDHMIIGSWIIGDQACGMGIREDHSAITQDLSRFVPHLILD